MRNTLLAAACLAASLNLPAQEPAAASAPAPLPKLWTVHVDTVEPALVKKFETALAAQNAARNEVLRKHQVAPRTLVELVSDGEAATYYTLRGRASMAEVASPVPLPKEVAAELNAKSGVFDDAIHETLVSHHNEVWELDPDLSLAPPAEKAPSTWLLRSEVLRPGREGDYIAALKALREVYRARGDAGFLVLESTWGDGAVKLLFWADDPRQLPAWNVDVLDPLKGEATRALFEKGRGARGVWTERPLKLRNDLQGEAKGWLAVVP